MRIDAVTTQLARLPLPGGAWGDAIQRVTHIDLIVTDVTTDTGLVGTGFSYTSGTGSLALKAMLDHDIAPFVVGQPAAPRALWQKCWDHLHNMGGGGVTTTALAALDIALWDLAAKEAGKSLVALLGPCRERVLAYASGINLNKSLAELVDQVQGWRAAGFKACKIKVGKPELAEDVERLTRVREVAGRLPVMVDANQGWDIGTAARAINALAPLSPHWVEEPLLADDVLGHARLRRLVPSPIAIGENVYTIQQFNHFLAEGACDFVQADVVRVGGITPYLGIAALARAWNVPLAPHFMMELSGQLLCCLSNAYILESIDGGSLSDLGALAEPITIQDGYFTPPHRPGHGIELDRDHLAAHALAA
ncbi:MAG TPA: mandelate racemase/muconate lactonizing enzyme family protein [Geminicoccaceae bacterium]|nr:mandelate racemase/muconate lactonizing enzyme family protein [Geminicoccaceae bacterium]